VGADVLAALEKAADALEWVLHYSPEVCGSALDAVNVAIAKLRADDEAEWPEW